MNNILQFCVICHFSLIYYCFIGINDIMIIVTYNLKDIRYIFLINLKRGCSMIKTLKWLSVVSTLGMVFILVGGALVTNTDSGAGCGSCWPLCHGELISSDITAELIIELSHRVVCGVMGVTVFALSVLAWKYIGHIREVKFLSFLSIFFLVLQGLIGAAAVMWGQSDFVLAAHFG